ncbi:MAG: Lrp/AsnC family transcriptional regulator [Erysipelotrichia bacterium]|nr:Lrp/AsnC family transcriptional regulator [Candidatus Riflebacteria bacterium]NCB38513.1 Lrp/AsnC family transcriptional regulator [Erysipelotrichia bacterium]
MDSKTRQILCELQDGFKLETRPFKRIATQVGCTEEEVIEIIGKCRDEGIIRRIGAAIRPDQAGYGANALVAWNVPDELLDETGNAIAEMREVSHCYERECPENWPYNLFTMIHARSEEDLRNIVAGISERFKFDGFKIFRTTRELKKTSMRYFEDVRQ